MASSTIQSAHRRETHSFYDNTHSTNPQHLHPVLSEPDFRHKLLETAANRLGVSPMDVVRHLENPAYTQVRRDYEKGLLTPMGSVQHALNQIVLNKTISKLRSDNPTLSECAFQDLLGKKITGMLLGLVFDKHLRLEHYKPKGTGRNEYGKYLLHSFKDSLQPFCLQLFVFYPAELTVGDLHERGQGTPDHNHIAPCQASVIAGWMQETKSVVQSDPETGKDMLVVIDKKPRPLGSVGGFDANELGLVHRLENVGHINDVNVRFSQNSGTDQHPRVQITRGGMGVTVHYYKEMDGVGFETPQATQLRSAETLPNVGKANVARLFHENQTT